MRKIQMLILLITINSFSQNVNIIKSNPKIKLLKNINEELTGEIGEKLFETEKVYYYEAIIIKKDNPTKPGMFGNKITTGHVYIYKGKADGYNLFFPLEREGITGVAIPESGGKQKIFNVWDNYELDFKKFITVKFKDVIEESVFEKIEYIDLKKDNFKQEFIFNGKSGNNLKFSYREYINNMARPAFNQELQYDLTDGNIVDSKV